MNYYNTTKETSEQVKMFSDKNTKQDEIVLSIINDLKRPFSAKDIYKRYPIANTPITSIRRSINTLKDKLGLIQETGERVTGLFGRSELQYTLCTS